MSTTMNAKKPNDRYRIIGRSKAGTIWVAGNIPTDQWMTRAEAEKLAKSLTIVHMREGFTFRIKEVKEGMEGKSALEGET